jgi:hypothetical protein
MLGSKLARRIIASSSAMTSTSTGRPLSARVVDQHLPHEVSRDPNEMRAIVYVPRLLSNEAQIGLVDERGTLQRVTRTLAPQIMSGEPVQLIVDERNQRRECSGIAGSPASEKHRHRFGRRFRHEDLEKRKPPQNRRPSIGRCQSAI